ncbi:MAG TPA: amidohydrolase family protein [Pirellulales bacterium]|nr:amidohydrolase family protein [Pirellulales bacterium]
MNSDGGALLRGRHYATGHVIELEARGDHISAVRELDDAAASGDGLPWLAPGFVDLQSNGYGGQEFSSLELAVDKAVAICEQQAAFGVTKFCPTVTTASFETIAHSLGTIARAARESTTARQVIAGVHLEGPYISREDGARGAHPLEHCREPDWNEFQRFQDAAEGGIRILTLSPDYGGVTKFIRQVADSGVLVAIGHTGADSDQIRGAVDAGARLSTHLGNGTHRTLRRHPNYIWDQMAEDRLSASLIVDGHHLPAEVVKTIVRAKMPERCILVSDLSGLAGLPPGRYSTQLCELEILADGRLVIAGQDQLLAGASRPIGTGVATVMRFAGVDLALAVSMASQQPARLIGLPENQLRVGDPADAVLFELRSAGPSSSTLEVRATMTAGRLRRF